MTREEKIALLVDELEDIRCDNFDADTDEDKTLKEAVRVIEALEYEPCEDAISRATVLEWIKGSLEQYADTYSNDMLNMWKLFEEQIKALPPIQPKAKMGHWIPTYGNVKCSVCGNVKDSRNVGKATHYCDFCGAKMEVE